MRKHIRAWIVHRDVHKGVESGSNPLDGDGVLEADPAEEEGHGVVVEVKETKGGLAKNDEDRV